MLSSLRAIELVPSDIIVSPFWQTWRPIECPYWHVAGKCKEMLIGHMQLLQKVFKEMYFDAEITPRQSKVICIGDLNRKGECPKHPYGTHSTGNHVDLGYYLFSKDNCTQHLYPEADKIFKNVLLPFNQWVVDPRKFDWRRNWLLWTKIIKNFPKATITTNTTIFHFIYQRLKEIGDYKGIELLLSSRITSDSVIMLCHHTHIHVSLGHDF